MRVALGLDIGTTAVKAIALDDEGRVVARAGAAHDVMTPYPGWAEGDPDVWWTNAVACIRRVGQDVPLGQVASVGVSGMVPALVLLGAGNRPLRPSIQQNDGRTGEEITAVRARLATGISTRVWRRPSPRWHGARATRRPEDAGRAGHERRARRSRRAGALLGAHRPRRACRGGRSAR